MNTDKPFELWWMPYPDNPSDCANKLIETFDDLDKALAVLQKRAHDFGNNQALYRIKEVYTNNNLGDIFP